LTREPTFFGDNLYVLRESLANESVDLIYYGPEQSWFDKTWKPGEFELVK
jgi:hypothetical protein